MAFRNPNEGMAKFLSSIGDMRRLWEQEEQVRQREARAAEQHKQQMEEAAQRIALNKTADERANLDANAKRLLDPLQRQDYTGRISNNELEAAGRRITNATDRAKYEQYLKDLAPGGWMETERDLTKRGKLADINQSNAAAGASAMSRREREAALAAQQRQNELMASWGKQPYGTGELTNEQALALGIKGVPGKIDSGTLRFIQAMAEAGTTPDVAAQYIENPTMRQALGLAVAGGSPAATPAPAAPTAPGMEDPAVAEAKRRAAQRKKGG